MRYKIKTPNLPLAPSEKDAAKRLGISERFFTLLKGRGMSAEEMGDYLDPKLDSMSDVFSIKGMRQAAQRVRQAIERKEKVLIYADYDCDGICAASILTLFLKDKTDVRYFIPERNRDGYGISVDALERVLKARKPDLVITVDCGITAAKEVEYLKAQGVDVIVTDHHEPQAELPDCITVDAKIEKKGFYELCGTGVAFRLVEAIAGMAEAKKYIDIAAIATVADVVPLVSENRIIAYYGLKQLNAATRKGVKLLFGEGKITSQDIMFRIAPRMNAAGRLGSAMKVVELFTETDYFMLKTLAEELERDNCTRQQMCEEAAEQAKAMLRGRDFSKLGIIILYSESWEAGILGIAAAKIVEEFKRPAILFAKSGNALKGSARSVPCVNIFELLSSMSGYFTSFGGHAQAAGVSIDFDNLDSFIKEANQKILATHPASDFMPVTECEMELPGGMDFLAFAKELDRMEPTGHLNPKPNFLIKSDGMGFERIGWTQHVKCSTGALDVIGFSKYADILPYKVGTLKIEVGLGLNYFQNNVTAQAVIRSYAIDAMSDNCDCLSMNLHQLEYAGEHTPKIIDSDALKKLLEDPFGTAIVCFDPDSLKALKSRDDAFKALPLYVGAPACLNPENCIILCPKKDCDLAFYARAVIVGSPLSGGYIEHIARSAEVYALDRFEIRRLEVKDDTLRNIYRELLSVSRKNEKGLNRRKLYQAVCSRYKVEEWVFSAAMMIFDALGVAKISDRGQLVVSRSPVRLDDSVVYGNICSLNK